MVLLICVLFGSLVFFPKWFIVLKNVLGDGSADSIVPSFKDYFQSECSFL